MKMPHSVVIADDHPIVLGGLRTLLEAESEFCVVATAADGAAAFDEILRTRPDIAVLDLNMPRQSGLQVLSRAREAGLATRIVILAAAASETDIHAIVTAGAKGLLFKESAPRVLMDCLTAVSDGETWLPPGVEQIVSRQEEQAKAWQSRMQSLTSRESELVHLVTIGRSNKEIAYILQLSEGTVKVHLHNIFRKLDISTRSELVSLAHQPVQASVSGTH